MVSFLHSRRTKREFKTFDSGPVYTTAFSGEKAKCSSVLSVRFPQEGPEKEQSDDDTVEEEP